MELWNRRNIRPPPNHSVKVKKGTIDVKNLEDILSDALKILKSKYTLHQEAALFSRYLYKTKRKYSSHKQFEYLAKVKQGLQRYVSLNLDVVYKNFSFMISSNEGVDLFDEWMYLPSKQMLEYLLVRTQGFCKVMFYVMVACQNSAPHLKCVLQMGYNVVETLIGLSLISRIWYCSKYYVICTCQWYSKLLPYLKSLKISGPPWLQGGYDFPDDLRIWLGPDPLTGEIMSCDVDVQKISNEIEKKYDDIDIGEVVNRSVFRRMLPTSKYGKLLMCAEDIPLPSRKPLNETPKENVGTNPSEDPSHDTGEVISREKYPLAKHKSTHAPMQNASSLPEMDCSSSKQIKFGSPEKPKLEASSEHQNTSLDVNPKSNAAQLFMATMSQISNLGSTKKLRARGKNYSVAEGSLKHCAKNGRKEESCLRNSPSSFQHNEEPAEHLDMKPIDKPCSLKSTKHPVSKRTKRVSVGENKSLQNISETSYSVNDETPISLSDNEQEKSICETKNPSVFKKSYSLELKCSSSLEQNSEVSKCVISKSNSVLKKKSKFIGNNKIVNGIRTVNDVKVFLHAEKKARAKGKTCVTSQLSERDWKILVEAIQKILRKTTILKLKGKKKIKSVMEDIRSTLLSSI